MTEQEEELKMKKVHAGYLRAASVSVMTAAVVLAGCASGGGDTQSGGKTGGEQTEILVAAAASLEYAFEEELIPLFEEAHPGVTVRGTYDSSGKLQTQIEEGMEADVFMSAARQQMDSLAEEGFVDGDSVADLLDNQIVLITPADNEAGLASFTDLTKADTIAELAEKMGFDPEVLEATVEEYNSYCATGVDEAFGKDAQYLAAVEGGPYYGIVGSSYCYSTCGGLDINTDFQVLLADGETPMGGLYAVGTDSMGVLFSEAKAYVTYGGAAQGWAYTSGRLAGQVVAEAVKE